MLPLDIYSNRVRFCPLRGLSLPPPLETGWTSSDVLRHPLSSCIVYYEAAIVLRFGLK